MAEVYVAKAKGIGGFEKLVAIKVIHPRLSQDEHFVQMLVEEAKISVQLNHVNIAQTFDLGCIDDTYFIAMEFVEGADIYRVIRRARDKKLALPLDICCYLVAEVCNGLGYAHRKRDPEGKPMGIVHRDISPQNVLVSHSGEVKIVDFGIAKAALRSGQTEVGVIKGKYYYMSPEQSWGDPVDQRSDVFSTGLLLHELLTGEMVYQEDNIPALLDRVRKAEIRSPRDERADVPEELARIVLRALAKEPEDRYPSAHAFAEALSKFLYSRNPTFTPSRLAQLMGTLFPEEVERHSQVLKLPTAEEEAARRAEAAEERAGALASMSRAEYAPSAEQSVIFDLDEVEDMTRNDILPFRRSAPGEGGTTQEQGAPARREEDPTAQLPAAPDDWEDETLLQDEERWGDSTLDDEEGEALRDLHRMYGGARRAPAGGPDELEGEATVATASMPPGMLPEPERSPAAPVKPFSSPATKRASPSKPPPGRLPPRPVAAPARPPAPPRPPANRGPAAGSGRPASPAPSAREGELKAEKTLALAPDQLPSAERRLDASGDDEPTDLPAEKTVALAEDAPAPSGGGGVLVSSGVKLGPEADRFFAQPSDPEIPVARPGAPAPFDAFGGTPQPIASGPGGPPEPDPFAAQPPPVGLTGAHAALGKPEPRKWVLPIVGAVLAVLVLAGVGAWIAARPDPTSLEIMTVPDGATVSVDGRTLEQITPVTLEDLEAGRTLRLEIRHDGYQPTTDELSLQEGLNRKVFLLNQVRVTLRVQTVPAGAQVWVDEVLRGSAPLDITGLAAGQTVRVRAAAPGHETATREVTVTADEERPRVTIELPEGE